MKTSSKSRILTHCRTALFAWPLVCGLVLASWSVRADTTYTFTGAASPDETWTNDNNWATFVAPPNPLPSLPYNTTAGTINFAGSPTDLLSIANTNWDFGRLSFDSSAGGWTLAGSNLTLEQGQNGNANYSIDVETPTPVTISNNVYFNNDAGAAFPLRQVFVAAPTGVLVMNGGLFQTNSGAVAVLWFRGLGTPVVNGPVTWVGGRVVTESSQLILNNSTKAWPLLAIGSGTVQLGANGVLPPTAGLDFNENAGAAILQMNGFNATVAYLSNSVAGSQFIVTGTNTGGTLTINDNGSTNVVGVVISGLGGVVKSGNGTLTLTGNSTYTGGTTIGGGTLQLGNNGGSGSVVGNVTNNAALVLNRSDTFTLAANISGSGTLFQRGSGAAILAGSDSFTGPTVVSNGTLSVASPLNNSSAVTVGGGVFSGTSSVGAPVTVFPGGALGAGTPAQPGTLTVNNATVNGAVISKLGSKTTIGTGVNDLVSAGTLTLGAGSSFQLVPLGNLADGTYVIATYTTLNGTFASINNPTRYGLALDYGTSGQIKLNVTGSAANLTWLGGNGAWDLATPNWQVLGIPNKFQQGDNTTFDDTGANPLVSLSGTLYPGSVTVNTANRYVFTGSGNIGGAPAITKTGTGTLVISNANTFTVPATVNNGTLVVGNSAALGASTTPAIATNAGTIDLNGVATGGRAFVLSGTGFMNAGALANFGGNLQGSAGPGSITLAGDTTIGAQSNRWDLNGDAAGSTGLKGNSFALTKVGASDIYLIDAGTNNGLGNITVLQGTLGFQGATSLGNPTNTASILGGGLAFFAIPGTLVEAKNLVFSNGTFSYSPGGESAGTLTLSGAVSLIGTNMHAPGVDEASSAQTIFNGPITGPGGWVKNDPGQDTFNGTNTYSGVTIINDGTLSLGTNSSLGATALIQLAPDTTLDDVSLANGLTLGAGQTLAGGGFDAANVTGSLNMGAGSSLSPAVNGPGSLSIAGNLAMAGATSRFELGNDPTQFGLGVNDYVAVGGQLSLSGTNTFIISPIAPLTAGTPYTLIAPSGLAAGGLSNLRVTISNPRYGLALLDPAANSGSVEIVLNTSPSPLVWAGGNVSGPNIWNHTFLNFINTGTSNPDKFYDYDLVTFDDTAVTNVVNVTDTNAAALLLFNNSTKAYTFVGNGTLGGSLLQQGTNSVTLALTNNLNLAYITNNTGTLVLNPGTNIALAAAISDDSLGRGKFVKDGTNQLTLAGDNSSYYGTIVVTNGVLAFTSPAAIGAAVNSLYATNGGTLNVGAVDTGAKSIVIAGAGSGGQGAINGGAPAGAVNGANQQVHNLTLATNATIGATAEWDMGQGDTLNAGTFTLTKVGPGATWLVGVNATLADVNIVGGTLGFQQGTSMGNPTKTIVVAAAGTCGLWANTTTALTKNLVLTNGGTLFSGGDSNVLTGRITLFGPGTNTILTDTDLHLQGAVGGLGGFNKLNAGTLYLEDANSYSGPTRVGSQSKIVLGAGSSLGHSSQIQIDGGSTIDASLPGLNLSADQTLQGSGTLIGNLALGIGATISPGDGPGRIQTLTVNGLMSCTAGSTNYFEFNKSGGLVNDQLNVSGKLTFGGTLVVSNTSATALTSSDALKLFNAGSYAGAFSTIVPATPGAGLSWNTNTLTSDGTLRISAGGTPTSPHISSVTISGGNVIMSGTNGPGGGSYSVLSQTNMGHAFSTWTVIATNQPFNANGAFSFTNALTTGTNRFFIIRVP